MVFSWSRATYTADKLAKSESIQLRCTTHKAFHRQGKPNFYDELILIFQYAIFRDINYVAVMLSALSARHKSHRADLFQDLRRWWGLIPTSRTNAHILQMPDTHGQRSVHRLDERIRENVFSLKPQGRPSWGNAGCLRVSLGKEWKVKVFGFLHKTQIW